MDLDVGSKKNSSVEWESDACVRFGYETHRFFMDRPIALFIRINPPKSSQMLVKWDPWIFRGIWAGEILKFAQIDGFSQGDSLELFFFVSEEILKCQGFHICGEKRTNWVL